MQSKFDTNFLANNEHHDESSRLTLHALSLDDVDGDSQRGKNRETNGQCNARLHPNVKTFMRIDALNNSNTTHSTCIHSPRHTYLFMPPTTVTNYNGEIIRTTHRVCKLQYK